MGRIIKVLGIIFIILGIIGSIYLGNLFEMKQYAGYSYYSQSSRYEYVFNTPLFIAGVVSSSTFGILMMGFGELINIAEDNRDNTKNLLRYLRMVEENTSKFPKNGMISAPESNTKITPKDIVRDIEDNLPPI